MAPGQVRVIEVDPNDYIPGMVPQFGENAAGDVIITHWSDPTGERPDVNAKDVRPHLPFLGEHSIFCRYLSAAVIDGGSGRLFSEEGVLPYINGSVRELIAEHGVTNVKSGFYNDAGVLNLFINLGCGAVFYEYLPCNTGKISLDYYEDGLGLRALEVTPYHVKAEILQDLNEAFKMLTQEMDRIYGR